MVYIPALERMQHRTYKWHVHEPIRGVSLWVRFEDRDNMQSEGGTAEYPIYQNTRGLCVWMSSDTDYGDGDTEEPSDAFWEALDKIRDPDWHGEISLEDCTWYEREALGAMNRSVDNPDDYSGEMLELMNHAKRQCRDGDLLDLEDDRERPEIETQTAFKGDYDEDTTNE